MAQKKYAREGYLEENYHYFHLRDSAGAERDFHFHEFDKIVLLLSGRVDYAMESIVYTLRPWDILLVPHHTIHKALIDKSAPYERIILYLDRKYFDRLMPDARLFGCFDRADERARAIFWRRMKNSARRSRRCWASWRRRCAAGSSARRPCATR